MDELINQITEKTGIPHDVAKQAADVVIGFLKMNRVTLHILFPAKNR